MKNVALMLPAMRMGGAEKICLNFIADLKKHCNLTVILNKKEGELLCNLPDDITVYEDKLWSFKEILRNDFKCFHIKNIVKDFIYYAKVKLGKDDEKNYAHLIKRIPQIEKKFDVAISYVANVSTQVFSLAYRVNAGKKIAWIHGETDQLKDTELFGEIYGGLDKIYCVSNVTLQHFVKRFPQCETKTQVYYNPINTEEILQKSKEPCKIPFKGDTVNILSVGRVTPEKGFDMIPDIVKILRERHSVKWFLIGDGPSLNGVKEKAVKNQMQNDVCFLGTKVNPYPFMRLCDIYVQPSYEEGYSTTVCEAGILGKAIIATASSGGIKEQIEDGVSGLIAEPNAESLAEKILFLIENESVKNSMEKTMSAKDFSNKTEIDKIVSEFL